MNTAAEADSNTFIRPSFENVEINRSIFSSHREHPLFIISDMPSSPPGESCLTQAQPCADGVVIVPEQIATPSLRPPSRAYPKHSIIRSKNSHITLAKPRRRHREYPRDAADQGRSSTLGRSRTCDLPSRSSCNIQDEIDTARTEMSTASKRRNKSICPADSKSNLSNNSCFLCLQRGAYQYAVVVNFAWPGRSISRLVRKKSKASTMNTVEISFDDRKFEKKGTQVQVMQAIQDRIYQQSGKWKRWLWCYEILAAEEVKVSLVL
jgi:hypothetical protein